MPLLRDGTVLRRTPLPRYPNTAGNATGPRPDSDDILGLDKGTPSCDVAPIEDVRQIVAGLSSTITFTFKAIEGEELERPRPSTGYTILCAEDNRVNQRLLSKILGKYEQDHVMTENGRQALEVYKANPARYPVILMDLNMPILDGLEATRLIRAFESTQHAYRSALIVCVTARYLYPIPPDVASAGFDIFLNKPFRVPLLYDMFLGGPETNIAMLYGCLTEEEKRAYPRRMIQETVLGDDPRSNAITDELNSPAGSNGNDLGICRAYFTKIIVKVIKAGEDEDGVRKGNKGEQVMKTEATDRRAFARR